MGWYPLPVHPPGLKNTYHEKSMRDIQELLSEKENQLERVRKEVESLHAVIPLLADERQEPEPDRKPVSSAQDAGAAANSKSGFWNLGRRQG